MYVAAYRVYLEKCRVPLDAVRAILPFPQVLRR